MVIDSHVHTNNFSTDAKMSFDDLLSFSGITGGFLFCAAEHFDYDHGDNNPENQLILDIYDYNYRFISMKNSFESQTGSPFPILFGIEFGYLEHLGNFYGYLSSLRKFDCVICSVHWIKNCDPFKDRTIYDKGKKYVYGSYLETTADMIKKCECFDVVGHFDYIARYAPYKDKIIRYRDFPDIFDEIFSLCINKGKSLELNTKTCSVLSGIEGQRIIFDPDILKRYKEMGGELITLGSDAHEKSSLTELFDETNFLLKEHGFKYIVYYKNRKPEFVKI